MVYAQYFSALRVKSTLAKKHKTSKYVGLTFARRLQPGPKLNAHFLRPTNEH